MTLEIDPSKTRNELNCRALNSILVYVEEHFGREELERFVSKTGLPLSYLRDQNNWVSWDYYGDLLQSLIDWTGDPAFPYRAGTYSWNKKSWGYFYYIYYALGNMGRVLRKMKDLVPHFNKASEWEIMTLGKDKATIRIRMKEGYAARRICCESRMGQFAGIPKAFGMPMAKVRETQCQALGADSCICVLSWMNRPKRYYGLIGIIPGVVLVHLLQQAGLLQGHDIISIIFIILAGYFTGRLFDFWSLIKSYRGQTTALEESVKDIECKYLNLKKSHEGHAAVHEIGLAVTSAHNVDRILTILLRRIIENLYFDRSLVMLVDEQEMVLHQGRVYGDESLKEFFSELRVPLDLDSPVAREVLQKRKGQIVTLDFIQRGEATELERTIFEMTRTREYLVVPIVWKDKLLGILAADHVFSGRKITDDEKVMLANLANQVAIAMENARTFQSS